MKLSSTPLALRFAVGAAALAIGAVACVPETPPTTTTSTTASTVPVCAEQPGSATVGSVTLTVSQATCLEVGDVVTVTGSGYTTTGNLGGRPPFPGQPAGVYAIFGEFADVWQPSLGSAVTPSSTRKVLTQQWAIPEPTFTAAGGAPTYVLLEADGTFTTELTISAAQGANPNLAFATYPGSGAVNAAEEILIPASWAPAEG
ncbi:MAG: hypothetical protein ACYC2O_05115 [Microthrixaceae bacterium]